MSGPKVVRIVTREEIIAICEGHIAALEAAFERWQCVGKRNEVITEEDIKLAVGRIAALRRLLANDEFEKLQKQAPLEIAFLTSDMEGRIEAAAEKAVHERHEGKRRLRAATTLANELKARGLAVPLALLRPEAHSQDELQAAISQGFSTLTAPVTNAGMTDRQRELASKLSDDEARLTLADWLARQPRDQADDKVSADLERRYAELLALDPTRADPLRDRVEKVLQDQSDRRLLLIDSLALEIAQARKSALAEGDMVQEVKGIETQLRSFNAPQTATHMAEISRVLAGPYGLEELTAVTASARQALDAILAQRADQDRRRAILNGLAELGYEVKEGMETAWVQNGRIVLKSKKSPAYGVELGGDPTKSMQLRTVSIGAGLENRAADIAAETEFCGDFSKLQEKFAADGGVLSIVKAMGIGTTAVRRVAIDEAGDASAASISPAQQIKRRF